MAEGKFSSSLDPVLKVGDTPASNLTLMELESEKKILIREIASTEDSRNTLLYYYVITFEYSVKEHMKQLGYNQQILYQLNVVLVSFYDRATVRNGYKISILISQCILTQITVFTSYSSTRPLLM